MTSSKLGPDPRSQRAKVMITNHKSQISTFTVNSVKNEKKYYSSDSLLKQKFTANTLFTLSKANPSLHQQQQQQETKNIMKK